jgi:hypothetical protein
MLRREMAQENRSGEPHAVFPIADGHSWRGETNRMSLDIRVPQFFLDSVHEKYIYRERTDPLFGEKALKSR